MTRQAEGKKILVTGGLGFVGFHLCQTLLHTYPECELTIVDNLSSTRLDYQALVGRAEIHIKDLKSYSAEQQFDEVFHLASPVGSLEILKRHGHIATDILELAHAANDIAARSKAKLIYLSSSEVYGRDGQHQETADQIVPDRRGTRMEYALGKLTAEHVLLNLADNHNHVIRIVRPFNIVGPYQCDSLGFVFPLFFKAALSSTPLLVHGDGKQTRSFCAVEDLVSGLLAVQRDGLHSTIYNVGNPHNRTSIAALASRIIRQCESESVIELVDPTELYGPRYLEAYNKMPAIDRVSSHTGWQPQRDLQQILRDLYRHYADRQENQSSTQHSSDSTILPGQLVSDAVH